jgi:hypothetical protein
MGSFQFKTVFIVFSTVTLNGVASGAPSPKSQPKKGDSKSKETPVTIIEGRPESPELQDMLLPEYSYGAPGNVPFEPALHLLQPLESPELMLGTGPGGISVPFEGFLPLQAKP